MFNVIPGNFFVPLSSPNRIVYWDCICRLFAVMQHQLSFGVEREVLADELQYYFEQSGAAEVIDEDFASSGSRDKATGILRRLEAYGWIETETDKSYVQRVSFQEYAVRIIRTLIDISECRKTEYQGYIYTIYSLVRSDTDNPAVELMQILDNTDLLITGLKNLNTSIKHYIDELTRHKSVAELMDALFNDYMINIVDKAYHRLLTSDNVSKFRPEIIERLEAKSKSPSYMKKASESLAMMEEISAEEARERIYTYLHEVIEAFRNMDDILDEIKRKNTQYQRAAVNRARFLLTGSEDVRGQLKEILSGINEVINEEHMDPGGIYEIEFLDGLIRIYGSLFMDENSFYKPVEGKKEFTPRQAGTGEPDPSGRRRKLEEMAARLEKVLDREKIDAYVLCNLAGRDEMKASQFPLESDEDFVRIIYIRLYGQRKNMSYYVETLGETDVGGYSFRDFRVARKTSGNT